MGFPRSATSAVSRLVEATGVDFGDRRKMRGSDTRNPDGYLELKKINQIDSSLLREAGHVSEFVYDSTQDLRPRGLIRRIRRMITRVRMLLILHHLSRRGGMWGIKLFPLPFHLWNLYIPKVRIVAVYRHPLTASSSLARNMRRWTFGQLLELWASYNVELLYHLSNHDFVLVKQESLQDASTRHKEMERVASFLGTNTSAFDGMFEDSKVPSEEKAKITQLIPDGQLPERVKRVWEILEQVHQSQRIR